MDSKVLKSIGGVASVIGAGITWYGYSKYSEAQSVLKAINAGDSLFGSNSSKSIDIWSGHSGNYKLMLIIGAVILVVGIILLISGLVIGGSNGKESYKAIPVENPEERDMSDRLKKLEELKNNGLITQEEYEEKRKRLISSI